jgi:molybdopterin synthase catalytic subunit
VKLFAILRERAGSADLELELPDRSTVSDASSALAKRLPTVEPHLSRVAYAVNQSYVDRATVLRDGDELALIPPVSGG